MRFVVLLVILIVSFEVLAESTWSELALRFTAESQVVREQSIKQLRKIKNLDLILTQELEGAKRYLALDVIGTLRLVGFIPVLKSMVPLEKTGMIFVTLNALMTSQTQKKFIQYYLESLDDNEVSSASKVVIVDTLSRMQVDLGRRRLKKIFRQEETPEVRSSGLNYVRAQLKNGLAKNYYFDLVEEALGQDPFQMRVQALFLIGEIPRNELLRFNNKLSQCTQDSNFEVRKICGKLKNKRKQ